MLDRTGLNVDSNIGLQCMILGRPKKKIYDYSIASPHNNYRSYFHNEELLYHGYKPEVLTNEPINRWFTPGWVEPIYVAHSPSGDILKTFPGLFRLFTATDRVYF